MLFRTKLASKPATVRVANGLIDAPDTKVEIITPDELATRLKFTWSEDISYKKPIPPSNHPMQKLMFPEVSESTLQTWIASIESIRDQLTVCYLNDKFGYGVHANGVKAKTPICLYAGELKLVK